jgi:hypothetical protein
MKPNYLVVGFPKGGTTSLCAMLGQHPQVFMEPTKEVSFFCENETWGKGFAWYESLFDAAGDKPMRGEGSQRYTLSRSFPGVAQRIADYMPEAKLIAIARHPIERIESMWLQSREGAPTGSEIRRSFERALELRWDSLVGHANYWREISLYRERFPDEQILILFYDDFRRDPRAVLQRCFEFLGVDPDTSSIDLNTRLNASDEKWRPGRFLSSARKLTAFRAGAKLFPEPVRKSVRNRLSEPPVEHPSWNPDTLARAVDELREDTERFLEFYGRPRDFWDLSRARLVEHASSPELVSRR